MSRTACLGNDVISRLYGKNIININYPKNRIDLLATHLNKKISFFSIYKIFHRYYILADSVYMQNQIFFDGRIKPKAIFFDSFSELTDQKFTHCTKNFSFYCNFSDLNSNSQELKNIVISNGLIELENLKESYKKVFQNCINTWGEIPIIFMHFPTKLDSREAFKLRAETIERTIKELSSEVKNLHSISIDDSYVDFAQSGNEEYRKLPYHYYDKTYEEFSKKIKELGVLNEAK
ncbi:hypothetical protein KKC13_01230 [bacterium]|nr:hypothetical protein [bacterium]MBU1959435.1 hypothetical protein [bacterium]